MFKYKDVYAKVIPAMSSLLGVCAISYPVQWGNYWGAEIIVDGKPLQRCYNIINMNKENFEYAEHFNIITQPVKVRIYEKDCPAAAIIDDRLDPTFYRLWDIGRGYCNSHLKEDEWKWVNDNLTQRFTGLDKDGNYIN